MEIYRYASFDIFLVVRYTVKSTNYNNAIFKRGGTDEKQKMLAGERYELFMWEMRRQASREAAIENSLEGSLKNA